jgi:hypothetical protein
MSCRGLLQLLQLCSACLVLRRLYPGMVHPKTIPGDVILDLLLSSIVHKGRIWRHLLYLPQCSWCLFQINLLGQHRGHCQARQLQGCQD